jgi:hypothetical protein
VLISTLIALAGNLVPLGGVLTWGWDPFQLLMLYWMETVILAGWTMARIGVMPPAELGTMTVNGRERTATNRMLVGFFSLHSGMFIAVHFLFLWLLFSDGWTGRVRGPVTFVRQLVIDSGAWIPLLFAFVAGLISYLVERQRSIAAMTAPDGKAQDRVGSVVGALYVRIVVMQVAIIAGGWFAKEYGSKAPLLIVIVLKTLFDLRLGGNLPFTASSSTGGKTTGVTPNRSSEGRPLHVATDGLGRRLVEGIRPARAACCPIRAGGRP